MKKKEVFDYLVITELMKEKAFSNVKKESVKKNIEKKMNTKGTYEYELFELYNLYYEEEDQQLKKDIGNRILKLIPNDFDIKSDFVYFDNTSTVEKIKGLEKLEKENVKYLNSIDIPLDGSEDLFSFVEGREYIRLLDKIAVGYLDLNKKDEYVKTTERLLFLNPVDSLSMLDNLSLVYFNRKEYKKIQELYIKHPKNLILMTLDYVIKVQEGKNIEKEMNDMLNRNHFLVFYFVNVLDIRQQALDRLGNINYFPYGSLQETLLALLDIETTLEDEALEIYMKSFLSYRGDAVINFLSEDEIKAMILIMEETNRSDNDPTKEKIYKLFDDENKYAKLENKAYIPNNDKVYLAKMLDKMVEKHLIEIDGVRVSLTLGGMMHLYSIMNFNNRKNEDEDDDFEEEGVLFS